MVEPDLSNKAVQLWKNLPGEVRGMALKADLDYVERERGPEGVRAVEETLERIGAPLKQSEINIMAFYPFWHAPLLEISIQDALKFTEEDFVAMGRFSTQTSLFLKLMFKYLVSIRSAVSLASTMWKKYYTVGNMRPMMIDEDKGIIVLRVTGFLLSAPGLKIIQGYVAQTTQIVVGTPVSCAMSLCGEGEHCTEYTLTWNVK